LCKVWKKSRTNIGQSTKEKIKEKIPAQRLKVLKHRRNSLIKLYENKQIRSVWDEEKEEYNVMLLQVDSEFVEGERRYLIIWGDCGIANFFIKEKDLKAQDFSNILYNWDCS